MLNERPYQVCLYVGPAAPALEDVRVVDLTPAAADVDTVCATLRGASLTPEDLRSRVLFVTDPDPAYRDRALVMYAALIGFAKRRLDVAFAIDGEALAMDELDRSVRTLPATRPDEQVDLAQAGGTARTDLHWVELGPAGMTPDAAAVIRYARRLRLVPTAAVQIAMPQLVAVAALRARGATERLPLLCTGDEPADTPDAGICLETARRGGEAARRDLRSGTRDALAPAETSSAFDRLVAADAVPVDKVLVRLGAKSKVVDLPARPGTPEHAAGVTVPTEVWHCTRPDRHTNGDANPSARIVVNGDKAGFQCFRCDPERVGSLRLVMDTLGLTGDEAADWILQGR